MAPPFPISADVREWLRDLFAGCNARLANTLSRVPTIHEVPLDMTFIQYFLSVSTPQRFESGWTVEFQTHYLGGGRHFAEWDDWPRRWEIADIGFLLMFRRGGKLVRSKVALLQSKRLYPVEQEIDEETPLDYMRGFGRLFHTDNDWADITESRRFDFTTDSRYQALTTGTQQYDAIAAYEQQRGIPVHYMSYNPLNVPSTAYIPLTGGSDANGTCEVGCRIVPAAQLRRALASEPAGRSPSYGQLLSSLGPPFQPSTHPAGWRLEHFCHRTSA